jgi:hypothetical protein
MALPDTAGEAVPYLVGPVLELEIPPVPDMNPGTAIPVETGWSARPVVKRMELAEVELHP